MNKLGLPVSRLGRAAMNFFTQTSEDFVAAYQFSPDRIQNLAFTCISSCILGLSICVGAVIAADATIKEEISPGCFQIPEIGRAHV